jgi:tRNA (adenine58-N1)-methyltransferase non-catalytic subunit
MADFAAAPLVSAEPVVASAPPDRTSVPAIPSTVLPSSHVILQFQHGDDSFAFAEMKRGNKVRIKRKQYVVDNLIGAPYGACFEIDKKGFKRVADTDPEADVQIVDTGADNRHLTDKNDAQSLTSSSIAKLKNAGVSGSEIIEKLVANSSTFRDKTAFSQAKYLKRKRQKYTPRVRLIRPCAQTLVECMHARNPQIINSLRPDSLSQLLHYAEIGPGSKVMVVDSTSGLVLGAVVERLGEQGLAMNIFLQSHPSVIMLDRYNFTPAQRSVYANFPFCRMDRISARKKLTTPVDDAPGTKLVLSDETAFGKYFESGFDSLVINTDVDAGMIARTLLPFLKGSRKFAVFSPFLQGLVNLYTELKETGTVLHMNLTETWLREIQVLDGRTRPSMTMEDSGGYLLSGIKVLRA